MASITALFPKFAVLLALAAGGCANQNSIFRSSAVGSQPRVFTMDAKQRNLVAIPDWENKGGWRICGEAAPDVFSALSTSAAADLGFGRSTSGVDARARAALAISEAAGSIERTQTINLLRESMYRTCERYLGGAIDKNAFVVQAGRDQRAMVAILAIEQLTRTARPPATILVSGTTGATISGSTELAGELSRVARAAEAARMRSEAAAAALAAEGCAAVPAPAADEPADLAAKRSRCAELAKAKTDADTDMRLAGAERDALRDVVAQRPEAVAARSGAAAGSVAGGTDETRSATEVAAVAEAVKFIVSKAFESDETQLFCLQYLSSDRVEVEAAPRPTTAAPVELQPQQQQQQVRLNPVFASLRQKCIEYAVAKVENETRLRSETSKMSPR